MEDGFVGADGETGAAAAHSVAGGWLGTYYYRGTAAGTVPPCRFEATLHELPERERFGGTILDDGPLGEAVVEKGIQQGRHVRFTKVYRQGDGHFVVPVRYVGTLSEDGKLLRGTWSLRNLGGGGRRTTVSGVWEARRLWSEAAEESAEPEAAGEELVGGLLLAGAGAAPAGEG